MTKEEKEERLELKEKAFKKILTYCRFCARSHQEIKDRLYALGLWKWEVEEILSRLIESNQVSEERFAGRFVESRVNKKDWGRMKIKKYLQQQHVSEYNIKHVMKKIDDTEYEDRLYEMAREKWDSIKGVDINRFLKIKKTAAYLIQRGYEYSLVSKVLDKLKAEEI